MQQIQTRDLSANDYDLLLKLDEARNTNKEEEKGGNTVEEHES
jgi:hypothetical protein